jgi:PHP family Zn ribbon phosphoesterase
MLCRYKVANSTLIVFYSEIAQMEERSAVNRLVAGSRPALGAKHMTICKDCKREYVYERRSGHRKTRCNSCNVSAARRRLKEKAVVYKGGKCKICSYNRYNGSLTFHHLDPSKKDYALSTKGLYRSWKLVQKELDKCILVCNNCHGEIHGGLIGNIPE